MARETQKFTAPLEVEYWITPANDKTPQPHPASTLHMRVKVHERQIELSVNAPAEAFQEMDKEQIHQFIIIELFNRFYPRHK
jgi:hypothetical protein